MWDGAGSEPSAHYPPHLGALVGVLFALRSGDKTHAVRLSAELNVKAINMHIAKIINHTAANTTAIDEDSIDRELCHSGRNFCRQLRCRKAGVNTRRNAPCVSALTEE